MNLFELELTPGICPGVGLLDQVVAVFEGTSILVSTGAAPPSIPTNRVGGFSFLHTPSSLCRAHGKLLWSPLTRAVIIAHADNFTPKSLPGLI